MIELKDLLQIDASIIAGLLVLLTIQSFFGQKNNTREGIFQPRKGVPFLITPFSISAIFSLTSIFQNSEDGFLNASAIAALFGFIYLLYYVGSIAIMKIPSESYGGLVTPNEFMKPSEIELKDKIPKKGKDSKSNLNDILKILLFLK